jgi:hypothetical protein
MPKFFEIGCSFCSRAVPWSYCLGVGALLATVPLCHANPLSFGTDLGLEWGGNGKSIQDEPHFQLRPKWAADLSERDMLAELRSRKDSGEGAYV